MKGLIILALGAWGATRLMKSAQRRGGRGPLVAATGTTGTTSGFPTADVDATGLHASSATDELSPNTAERLQQTQSGGAFAGADGGIATPRPFPAAGETDGDDPRPGLPDFARGA